MIRGLNKLICSGLRWPVTRHEQSSIFQSECLGSRIGPSFLRALTLEFRSDDEARNRLPNLHRRRIQISHGLFRLFNGVSNWPGSPLDCSSDTSP